MMKNAAIRSVAACLAGFALLAVTFFSIGYFIETGPRPGEVSRPGSLQRAPASLAVELIRLLVAVFAGGLVAAAIAGTRALWHASAFGAMMAIAAILDGLPPEPFQPLWYSLLTVALLTPASLAGGFVARAWRRRSGSRREST